MNKITYGILICISFFNGCIFDANPRATPGSIGKISPEVVALLDSLMPIIEVNRGLKFKRHITPLTLSRQQYIQQQGKEAGNTVSQGDMFFNREIYQLGIVEDSAYEINKSSEGLNGSSVAGFYIPHSDTLFVIKGDSTPTIAEWEEFKHTVYHELVHALQDQALDVFNKDIASVTQNAEQQVDFMFARRMVIEGDAEYNAMIFSNQESSIDLNKNRMFDFPQLLSHVPLNEFFLTYTTFSPYLIGPAFIRDLFKFSNNTWGSVNTALKDNGLTSAETITGKKVSYHQFPAEAIRSIVFTKPNDYIEDANLGILNIIGMLKDELPSSVAKDALGWTGDHLFYTNDNYQTDGNFIWCFSFELNTQAAEFRSMLYSKISNRKIWDSNMLTDLPNNTGVRSILINPNTRINISQIGNAVYWIENMQSQEAALLNVLSSSKVSGLAKSSAPTIKPKYSSRWNRDDIYYRMTKKPGG